jgi:hypothetical protein
MDPILRQPSPGKVVASETLMEAEKMQIGADEYKQKYGGEIKTKEDVAHYFSVGGRNRCIRKQCRSFYMNNEEYYLHLKSPAFLRVKFRRLKKAGWKCENCGRLYDEDGFLDPHHLNYECLAKPNKETIRDIKMLCRGCHNEVHDETLEMYSDDEEGRIDMMRDLGCYGRYGTKANDEGDCVPSRCPVATQCKTLTEAKQ